MKLTCSEMLQRVVDRRPTLPAGGRLETALLNSSLNVPVTLVAIAYKESLFDPAAANGVSTAQGLFQFVNAEDTQDRVMQNFLPDGTVIPSVPGGERFADYHTDAD